MLAATPSGGCPSPRATINPPLIVDAPAIKPLDRASRSGPLARDGRRQGIRYQDGPGPTVAGAGFRLIHDQMIRCGSGSTGRCDLCGRGCIGDIPNIISMTCNWQGAILKTEFSLG